ncbi:hypothetical protein [Microbacterium luticocti]|uniref:hypothetical protein n=1 Tax=Microbacterium luticocti TaxID=451764 RepID=UPI000418396E|nr:hypothetical protein [Microbacterium luticocti]
MSTAPVARPFEARHLQLARAVVAAIAAAMITFSSDHSAALGLAVFSGFAITTALFLFVAAWLAFPAGARWPVLLLGAIDVVAGMVAGVGPLRTDGMFFGLVIAWAVASGIAELAIGLHARRRAVTAQDRSDARDALSAGVLGLVLAVALLLVPAGFAWTYTIAEAHRTFTLTGITIGVGIFGGYAAIVAVYLGIAGFSPRKAEASAPAANPAVAADAAASDEKAGGAA